MILMFDLQLICQGFPGCNFFYTDQHFCTLFSEKDLECDGLAGPAEPEISTCNQDTTTLPTTTRTSPKTSPTQTTTLSTSTIAPTDLSGILFFGGSYHNGTQFTNEDVTFVSEDSWCILPNVSLPYYDPSQSNLLAVQIGRRIMVCGFWPNYNKECYVAVSDSLASNANWKKIASRSFSNYDCAYAIVGSTVITTTGWSSNNNLFEFFDFSQDDNQWETVDLNIPNIPTGKVIDNVLAQKLKYLMYLYLFIYVVKLHAS